MHRRVHTLILAGFLVLTGCHAKDTSSRSTDSETRDPQMHDSMPAADPEVTPSKAALVVGRNDRPVLVCFGDSLTAGFGTDPGQSYPDYLQADLDAKGYRYYVENKGVSGATSKDGVARLPEILALKPAVVIVEFGGNDGLRGLPIKDIEANLDRIVRTLKASGAKVVLAGITLPPDYGPDYVSQFTATYPALAKKYQVPVLPFLLQGVFGVEGMMQQDRTHATARGNAVVARNVLPVLEPILKK